MVKKQIKTGKVISLSDYIRNRHSDRNIYILGRNTYRRTDTLVPAYCQIMDMMEFIDKMVREAIASQADKLFFKCNGETGICRIKKNGKLIQEYPIERCIPLLNHIKVIFGLDRTEKQIPKRWETYKIKTEDVIMTSEVEARREHQFQILDEMAGLLQENYFGNEWDSRAYNPGPA